ncbi:hypothetical protein [Streptomyces nigra]|uniref:hypothetical protein n=1 Tax=Streptomyces nigra TaxID=1827580 RepID=UPI0030CABC36
MNQRMRECARRACRREFLLAATGRPAKYCSPKCRRLAWDEDRREEQEQRIEAAVRAERERAEAQQREAVVAAVARALAGQRPAEFRSDVSPLRPNETPGPTPPQAGARRVRAEEIPLPLDVQQPYPPQRPWPVSVPAGAEGAGEPCPYCRAPVPVGLVDHMRRCPDRPDANGS